MVPEITLTLIADKINLTSGFKATVSGDTLTVRDPKSGGTRSFSRHTTSFEELSDLEYRCMQLTDLKYFKEKSAS